MQDRAAKLELIERSLERAAETVGDITAPLMARFYAAHPAAEASFEHHGLGKHAEGFVEHFFLVRREVDDAVGNDDIHSVAINGKFFEIALTEFDVRRIDPFCVCLGTLDHFGSHVHADHASFGTDFLGCQ